MCEHKGILPKKPGLPTFCTAHFGSEHDYIYASMYWWTPVLRCWEYGTGPCSGIFSKTSPSSLKLANYRYEPLSLLIGGHHLLDIKRKFPYNGVCENLWGPAACICEFSDTFYNCYKKFEKIHENSWSIKSYTLLCDCDTNIGIEPKDFTFSHKIFM